MSKSSKSIGHEILKVRAGYSVGAVEEIQGRLERGEAPLLCQDTLGKIGVFAPVQRAPR